MIFYGDPFFHAPEHSPHSTQEQGYVFFEDLHDPRYDIIVPGFYTFGAVMWIGIMLYYADINAAKPL